MDFAKFLQPYQNTEESKGLTPESQVRWLRKLGFSSDVIDRSMIALYTELEQGKKFKDWQELQICLRDTATLARTKDEAAYIQRLQDFEAKLRKKWQSQLPWWKRLLGIKK